jgi:hypothetical protein
VLTALSMEHTSVYISLLVSNQILTPCEISRSSGSLFSALTPSHWRPVLQGAPVRTDHDGRASGQLLRSAACVCGHRRAHRAQRPAPGTFRGPAEQVRVHELSRSCRARARSEAARARAPAAAMTHPAAARVARRPQLRTVWQDVLTAAKASSGRAARRCVTAAHNQAPPLPQVRGHLLCSVLLRAGECGWGEPWPLQHPCAIDQRCLAWRGAGVWRVRRGPSRGAFSARRVHRAATAARPQPRACRPDPAASRSEEPHGGRTAAVRVRGPTKRRAPLQRQGRTTA